MSFLLFATAVALSSPAVEPQLITLPQPGALGQQLDGPTTLSIRTLSSNGNVVVYATDAANVLAGDTNRRLDVYAFNRATQAVVRASLDATGAELAWDAIQPSVSGDGEWAMYATRTFVVSGPLSAEDVGAAYLRNLLTGEQRELGGSGVNGVTYPHARRPFANTDATLVSFHTNAGLDAADTNGYDDVYLYRRASDTYEWVSRPRVAGAAQYVSRNAVISDSGAVVAFDSDSDGLVAGDSDSMREVFVYEPQLDRMRRLRDFIAVIPNGPTFHPSLSRNGRWLVFAANAGNLPGGAGIFRVDLATGSLTQLESINSFIDPERWQGRAITDDGRVAFDTTSALVAGDQNGASDVYLSTPGVPGHVRLTTGTGFPESTVFAGSVLADGSELLLQAFGRFVVADTNRYSDLYSRSLAPGPSPITLVQLRAGPVLPARSNGDAYVGRQSISADGRYVVFDGGGSTVVAGDTNDATDVFVHDRSNATTRRISVAAGGAEWSRGARCGSISADGRFAVLVAAGTDLGNGQDAAFVARVDLATAATAVVATAQASPWGAGYTGPCPVVSGDGRHVAFLSSAIEGVTNTWPQVYLRDMVTGEQLLLSRDQDGVAGALPSQVVAISADGNQVAFDSGGRLVATDQDDRTNIHLWTRGVSGLRRAPAPGVSSNYSAPSVAVTEDGRVRVAFVASTIAFPGVCSNDNAASAYVWDPATNAVACASDGLPQVTANAGVTRVSLSPNARHLAINANACNGTTGSVACGFTFHRHMPSGLVTLVSARADGTLAGWSAVASVSNDGIVALSTTGALVPEDLSGVADTYVARTGEDVFRAGFE